MELGQRLNRGKLYLYLNCSEWAGTEKAEAAYKVGKEIVKEIFPSAYITSGSHAEGRYIFRAMEDSGSEKTD